MEKRKSRAGEVYEYARAAITKCHQLVGINNRNLLAQGWRPEVQDQVSKVMIPLRPYGKVWSRPLSWLLEGPWLMAAQLQFSHGVLLCMSFLVSNFPFLSGHQLH